MRRWLYLSALSLMVIGAVLFATQFFRSGSAKETKEIKKTKAPGKKDSKANKDGSDEPLTLQVVPWGPTQETLDAASRQMMKSAAIQKYLRGTNYRLLSFGSIATDDKGNANQTPPTRYRGIIYDYTNSRTIIGEGSFNKPSAVDVTVSNEQPLPGNEEVEAAIAVLMKDPEFGPSFRDGSLVTYEPMPPLLFPRNRRGQIERTINVGVRSTSESKYRNEIVGINMVRETIMRFPDGAPPTSLATPDACGSPSAGQSTTSNGTAGQFAVTVFQGTTQLWSFLAIRPSASSGNSSERSGIELQNVTYRGKSVLKRAHVPVLNVKYDGDACGPYRDWQYQEGMFQTDATSCTDVGTGFRVCKNPATTEMETQNDTGNFKGVAVYTQGTETVLVTELNAGWYRYIHEWRLDSDGTIRPRYGFGATNNSCVCFAHHHHVYWRFDFDINTPGGNAVYPAIEDSFWQPPALTTEAQNYRFQGTTSWIVKNLASGDGYKIRPGNDGTAFNDPFAYGKGDVWILQYHSSGGNPTELDDPNTNSSANIDAWLNSESVYNQDIVVWYGGHFDHTDGVGIANILDPLETFNPNIIGGDHVIGPDLIPVSW